METTAKQKDLRNLDMSVRRDESKLLFTLKKIWGLTEQQRKNILYQAWLKHHRE